jgi:hypothetical protein
VSKIWYCRTCGYEVTSRGKCHQCRQRLTASPLAELDSGSDDEEVGYRIETWTDRGRGRLIEALIDEEILHRFEDDELVVAASDEERVDDLIAAVSVKNASSIDDDDDDNDDDEERAEHDGDADADWDADDESWDIVVEALELLRDSAGRLREDPTDMQADADVAEVSTVVFVTDDFAGTDPDTWAAVGRVTRRLLAALGADEAMEDEIRREAGILVKLLDPVFAELADTDGPPALGAPIAKASLDVAPAPEETSLLDTLEPVSWDEPVGGDLGDGPLGAGRPAPTSDDDDGETATGVAVGPADVEESDTGEESDAGDAERTVYELPEWLPEQRAELSILLDRDGIDYSWEGDELVVAASAESAVEALFDQVEGVAVEEDDDEARYHALEELFASAIRLAREPVDSERRQELLDQVDAVEGPTPLGLDDAAWWRLRKQTRIVADAVEHDASVETVAAEAATLRDQLRALI